LDKNLPPWPQRSAEAQEVYAVRFDAAIYGDDINYDLARHIITQRAKFARWLDGGSRLQSNAVDSNRAMPASQDIAGGRGVIFANVMLILIGRALHMLDRLLKQHGEEFIKEGGFSERMTAARVEEKRAQRKAVNEDAPSCPKCGGIMRVRHGKTGEFWGCVNYPACKGTREVK
jgi:four helix bundle suffix protein